MNFEFIIPVSRDDLLRKTSVNQYCVAEVLSRSTIPKFKNASRNNAFAAVESFDAVFSVLIVQRDLDSELVEDVWHSLVRDMRVRYVTGLKMTMYLFCQFIEMYETETSQPNAVAVKKIRGKSTKQQTKSGIDWDGEREAALSILVQILQLNLNKLWVPPIAEEDFVSLVSSCLYKLLENPASATAKGKEMRDAICHGIGTLVKRCNHSLSASLKIVQMLKHFEHLVSPLAQMAEVIVNHYGNKTVIRDIMREIGQVDPQDVARDSSGARAFSQFLVEIAEKVPAAVLPNVSVVLALLDGESYSLRNGVLGMMGEILTRVLNKDDLDQHQRLTRDGFFDRLQDHIHDCNAFVRSKVLQIWLTIVNEKSLPLPRQEVLVSLVLGRLQDKSSQVRRYAIQLLTAILRCNPFAAKLSVEELAVNYEKEKAKLEEMITSNEMSPPAVRSAEDLEEEWNKILPAIKQALTARDEMDISSDTDVDSITEDGFYGIMDKIYSLLIEEHYHSALILLQAAKLAFSEEDIFQDINQTPDADGSEVNCDYISMLKKIFYEHHKLDLAKVTEAASCASLSQLAEGAEVNELTKQQVLVQYLKNSLAFAGQIQEAVPIICQLLGSKNTSDVFEAIEFFVTSYEFGVSAAIVGIRRMLVLIWSKEQAVKDTVVSAYKRLYLEPTGSQRAKAIAAVKNLIKLILGASCGDITSLEALMTELMHRGEITPHVIQVLWERFTLKISDTSLQESRAALLLISMVAEAERDIVRSNLEVLVEEGLGPRAEGDWLLAQAACQAVLKLASKKTKGQTATEPFCLPPDHLLFSRLRTILVTGLRRTDSSFWVPLSEKAVTVIYRLADQPDMVCGEMIRQMASLTLKECQAFNECQSGEGEVNIVISTMLTRLLSFAGQVAIQQLVHLEVNVLGELKRRNILQEDKNCKKKKNANAQGENIEEEMGLAGMSADDAEAEYIRRICEKDIVVGPNLLAAFQPLLFSVCTNQGRYPQPELRTAATLALAKFMSVSSDFCEQHLQLMFTILEKSPSEVIRANSMIAVGDLAFRFPNLIEPWTPHLYNRLRDESRLVRRYALQVLTHLILNDMVKVKGQISELAICVVDNDEQISGLAKLFFHELAKKGNALYNILPDAISRLSDPDLKVEEDHFHTIMKYLFSFIQKDKLCESLIEKLCHRYRATRNERQWRDLSFCLSMLSYSDKGLRKLQENFSCFSDKLVDDAVYGYFVTIISKSRTGFTKPEAKVLLDELEERIEQGHRKGLDEEETTHRASKASSSAAHQRKQFKTSGKTKMSGRRKAKQKENVENYENAESPPIRKSTLRRPNQRPKFVLDSDEDEEELFDIEENDESGCFDAASPVPARTKGGKVPLGRRAQPLTESFSP
ncbi:hypothetical protein C0Q70_03922 [Pomacea canaliculata]|uniref:Condensin complex subunit 1 n=1 Tax=Pomacea canaliculata TaxID=400727 RepID=A0A2T7PU40_POMCA|nr:hypothetical protein C0Q70_03922 [Pomacea canaliculata]